MSKTNSINAQAAGRLFSRRCDFVESAVALIVVAMALVVLMCLAAVAPAVWTFATTAAAESYLPVGPSHCSSIKNDASRLACYDELTQRPTKGGSGPPFWGWAKCNESGDRLNAPALNTDGLTGVNPGGMTV